MKSTIALTLAALVLVATPVLAARPTSLANTTWTLVVNGTAEELFIDVQGGPGAPGSEACRRIRGLLRGIPEFDGWYCPSTGAVFFVHRNLNSNYPMRVFRGTVADDVAGQPRTMAGTVMINNAVFGDLGEYGFTAEQQ